MVVTSNKFFNNIEQPHPEHETQEECFDRLPGPDRPSPDLLLPQPLPHPIKHPPQHHEEEPEGPLWRRDWTNHEVTRRGRARLRDGAVDVRRVEVVHDGHRGSYRRSCHGRGNDDGWCGGGGGGGAAEDARWVAGGCGCEKKICGDCGRSDQGDGREEEE